MTPEIRIHCTGCNKVVPSQPVGLVRITCPKCDHILYEPGGPVIKKKVRS